MIRLASKSSMGKSMAAGGGDPKDKLLIAGLGAVIVVAIVVAVMSFTSGGRSGGPGIYHFQCLKPDCGHKWEWSKAEVREVAAKQMEDGSGAMGPESEMMATYECPKCAWKSPKGPRWSGVRALQRQAGQTYTPTRIMNLPTTAKEENWLLDPPQKPTVSL